MSLPFYDNKVVLLTGCTGFIGKVILEKLLRTFPKIQKICILLRVKKNQSAMERFKKEILGSECFDRVRSFIKNFDDFIEKKIVLIKGDLCADNLGISQEDKEYLINNVNVVLNCAASVDFNQRLDEAIQINIFGSLKLLMLAKQMKYCESFVQVSTCYTNCDKNGWVEEKIYHCHSDPQQIIDGISKYPIDYIEKNQAQIIHPYPNTYTYTKYMSEQILEANRGDISMTIVRPSIVGASFRDPYPGWVDAISAGTAFYFFMGLGILQFGNGKESNIACQIPCDFVSDYIIVSAACYANQKKLQIVHCGTSHRNSILWGHVRDYVIDYFTKNPTEMQVRPLPKYFPLIEDNSVYQVTIMFHEKYYIKYNQTLIFKIDDYFYTFKMQKLIKYHFYKIFRMFENTFIIKL